MHNALGGLGFMFKPFLSTNLNVKGERLCSAICVRPAKLSFVVSIYFVSLISGRIVFTHISNSGQKGGIVPRGQLSVQ